MALKTENLVETFMAAVWNVYAGTPTRVLEPILVRLRSAGVTMFLMSESRGNDITRMLETNGVNTWSYDQWRIAWDPEVWEPIRFAEKLVSEAVISGARGRVQNYLVIGWFRHKPSGKKVKVISYHTPAHVQKPEWNKSAPNRWRVLVDAAAFFKKMAHIASTKIEKRGRFRYILAGGDDNVDERRENGQPGRWDFLLSTGLTQIQAPEATHGRKSKDRKIDDFRVLNLEPVDEGFVTEGGGDHRVFVLTLRFMSLKAFFRKLRRKNKH